MTIKKTKPIPKKKGDVDKDQVDQTNNKETVNITLNLSQECLKNLENHLDNLLSSLDPTYQGQYTLPELIEKYLEHFFDLAEKYREIQETMLLALTLIESDEGDLMDALKNLKKLKNKKTLLKPSHKKS